MSNETQQPQFVFTCDVPTTCATVEQAKCLIKIKFQKVLDEFFAAHEELERETVEE